MKKYSPELGQLGFGNPFGEYVMDDFSIALTEYLFEEIGRIYWNINQKDWDEEDPEIKGITYNPYYWGESPAKQKLPNFKIKGSKQEIRWYKYPGRGQTCTIDFSPEEWKEWFESALKLIRKNEIYK
jgi:hypothetical protein